MIAKRVQTVMRNTVHGTEIIVDLSRERIDQIKRAVRKGRADRHERNAAFDIRMALCGNGDRCMCTDDPMGERQEWVVVCSYCGGELVARQSNGAIYVDRHKCETEVK